MTTQIMWVEFIISLFKKHNFMILEVEMFTKYPKNDVGVLHSLYV